MAQIRVWGILGESDSGKSTVIGHLISQLDKGPGGFRIVPLRGGGYMEVYARRQSLQEAKRAPGQVIEDTLALIQNEERKHRKAICFLNLLLAIRTDVINRLPSAVDYLSEFVRAGWSVESLVVLGYEDKKHSRYYKFGTPICEAYSASEYAADLKQRHLLLGQVRNHFGWA
jgi:hypothetical protein